MTTTPGRLTSLQWLICAIAALGFAFDIYEILMAPLVVGPAIAELTGYKPGTPEFNLWTGLFFWVPALVGGAFGLIGGYLTDRFGRRSVLVWSILLYAFSAMAAGFATNVQMLLILRSTTYIGVFVEFVAAVAWIAEIFPDAKQREAALGYTQAFSSIGGLMVTGAYYIAVTYGPLLPEIAGGHAPWRYTLISGVIPALPLIIIRPFLPESPAWQQKKAAGTLRRPSIAQLFTPELRRTTIVTTLMFAFAYGAAFGAIQQMPRIVPGIPEVRTLPPAQIQQTASATQAYQEFGGLAGRFLLAVLALRIVSRQKLIRTFQIPGLLVMPFVFYYAPGNSLTLTQWGMFLAGVFTVGQLSFWGNYLPRVYPTHLRGTGEGFAANIGGRMLGTGFAFITTTIATYAPGDIPSTRLAFAATIVGTFVYVAGLTCSFFLPEPKSEDLPE
ncbi:MAG TPA: MFS transporter [Vicinamibacterales bacterium]|nr:MFS transporter [Vicinamibacterales bacterium]